MHNSAVSYDNQVQPDNVYGHALELLARNREATTESSENHLGIHLDVGCGYGRIAEAIKRDARLHYVGIDAFRPSLDSLSERGFEVHEIDLESSEIEALLATALGGRKLVSVTFLDTLEHLINGERVLKALAKLSARSQAPVVISVPNMTHQDIALRLLLGGFEYTGDGLLDHTHVRMFGAASLSRMLKYSGLHKTDDYNVVIERSDQHFPPSHPALSEHTSLGRAARSIRQRAEANSTVNQFIWACIAGPQTENTYYFEPSKAIAPFLSIITRTQGTRNECLIEVLTCLAGQSCIDFEVLVLGHRLDLVTQKELERVLEDTPSWLREKIRLIKVDSGNRTRPLNVGFEAARGDYIAILDDDDLPMANWVEVFKDLAGSYPGRTLRAANVRQNVSKASVLGHQAVRAVGPLERIYPDNFDFALHLVENQTPPVSIAFPRAAFQELKVRFDESLTTTEDWDFLLRVASITDVACSTKISSIYRWWIAHESSRTQHSRDEWDSNHEKILLKSETELIFMPSGMVRSVRELIKSNRALRVQLETATGRKLAGLGERRDREATEALREDVLSILNSTSWKISSPLRVGARLAGRPGEINPPAVRKMNFDELHHVREMLLTSRSWRVTKVIRRIRGHNA